MSTRNFPYLKFRLKNRGSPRLDPASGQERKISNTDYGQNIPRLLAYTGCTKIRDEVTGQLFNFERKDHLLRSYVATPPNCSWARDREYFANKIMEVEKHPRARLGRDGIGARPKGMPIPAFEAACVGYAQATYDWLSEHFSGEPMLSELFDDFELLLNGPAPEEGKIPELPPEPTIGDLFESIAMWIDRLELRKRPRPHYERKWREQQGQERTRGSPLLAGLER